MRALAIVIVLCTASSAHAEEKSETTALALSVPPFVVGAGLITTAAIMHDVGSDRSATAIAATTGVILLTVGPTLGHVYAGRVWSSGLAVRLVGIGVAIPGALLFTYGDTCGKFVCGAQVAGAGLVAAGGLTLAIGGIMDIASTRDVVRAHNASLVVTPSSVSLAGTF